MSTLPSPALRADRAHEPASRSTPRSLGPSAPQDCWIGGSAPTAGHFAVNTLGLLAVLAADGGLARLVVAHPVGGRARGRVGADRLPGPRHRAPPGLASDQDRHPARAAPREPAQRPQLWLVGRQAQRPPRPPQRPRDRPRRARGRADLRRQPGLGSAVDSAATVTRHQAWLFFPLLTFEAVNLYLAGIRSLVPARAAAPGRRDQPLIAVHTVVYLTLRGGHDDLAAGAGLHRGPPGPARHLPRGLLRAQPQGHAGPVAQADEADPFLRQVLTSRNIRGGPVVDWALGGLNYQIEHHLFPSMPRANLPQAQLIVRSVCERDDVPYVEASARSSYADVLRHLHAVGAPLRLRD